jgi:hypothetical protein
LLLLLLLLLPPRSESSSFESDMLLPSPPILVTFAFGAQFPEADKIIYFLILNQINDFKSVGLCQFPVPPPPTLETSLRRSLKKS